MQPWNTIEQLSSHFLGRTPLEIKDSEVLKRHEYSGYEFSHILPFQVHNGGYVLKCFTPDNKVFTIDRTGEINNLMVSMAPSDTETIKALHKAALERHTAVGDVEVKKKEVHAKQTEEKAKAEERKAKALQRWLDAWLDQLNQQLIQAATQATANELEHYEVIQLASLIFYEKCMVLVAKFNRPAVIKSKQVHLAKARVALAAAFTEYYEKYNTQPKLPPKAGVGKAVNDLWRNIKNAQPDGGRPTHRIPFGETLSVEYFMKKIKFSVTKG